MTYWKDQFWIEHVLGSLFCVKHEVGGIGIRVYEGYESDCEDWINKNCK